MAGPFTQTSRVYGIKVKEVRDYYEYKDIIVKYEPNADENWIIKSNHDVVWMNGKQYPKGSVIGSFKDGTIVRYVMMAQHESLEEVTNILYYVTSDIGMSESATPSDEPIPEPEPEPEDQIKFTIKSVMVDGLYSKLIVKKYKNNEEVGITEVTPTKIVEEKMKHPSYAYNFLRVFRDLAFDWESSPQNYFSLYSSCNYLEWNGSTYQLNNRLSRWSWNTPVDMEIFDYSQQYSPVDPSEGYPIVKYLIGSQSGTDDTIIIQKISDDVAIATETVNAERIRSYKNASNGQLLKIFGNLLFDWHGMDPESGYPQYSFTLVSNSNYLKYEGQKKLQNEEIKTWQKTTSVQFEVYDESNKYSNGLDNGETFNVSLAKYIDGHQEGDTVVLNKGNSIYFEIYHDHKDMYYNGHYHKAAWLVYDQPNLAQKIFGKLAISWADPYWVLFSTTKGIYFNGRTYEARKLLKTWTDEEDVHLTLQFKNSRKKQNTDVPFDDVQYVIVTDRNTDILGVAKQVNDYTEEIILFDPTTECPKTFHNIRFTYSAGKIYVYSLCDYIRLSGRTYQKGTLVIIWDKEEKVNFAIEDETNKYEVVLSTTYEITTEQVTETDYEVKTQEDNSLLVYKLIPMKDPDTGRVIEYKPSGEETIYYYDGIRGSYDKDQVYYKITSTYTSGHYDSIGIRKYKSGVLVDSADITSQMIIAAKQEHPDFPYLRVMNNLWFDWHGMNPESGYPAYSFTLISGCDYLNFNDVSYKLRSEILTWSWDTFQMINVYDYTVKTNAYGWYVYNGLIFDFNPGTMMWTLMSGDDDLYMNNTNYKSGEVMQTWSYYDQVNIKNIGHIAPSHKEIRLKSSTVDTKNSYKTSVEHVTNPVYTIETITDQVDYKALRVTCDQPGSTAVTRIIHIYDVANSSIKFFQIIIGYVTASSEWYIKSDDDKIYVSDVQYKVGEIVSKWGYDTNVNETIEVLVEDIKHTEKNDEVKEITLAKDDGNFLYGYIWRKFNDSPAPSSGNILFLVYRYSTYSGYSGGVLYYDTNNHQSRYWGILSYSSKSTDYFRDLDSTSIRVHLRTAAANSQQTSSIIYSDEGESGITYVNDIDYWEQNFYWESFNCAYTNRLNNGGFKKCLISFDSLTVIGTFTEEFHANGYKTIVGKIGQNLIVWVEDGDSRYSIDKFYVINFETNTIVEDCADYQPDGLDEFIQMSYPYVVGTEGTDPVGPHSDGYTVTVSVSGDNSDDTFYSGAYDDYGCYYLLDNELVFHRALAFQYVRWSHSTLYGHEYWHKVYDPVITYESIAIKYTSSGFSYQFGGGEDIMAKAMFPYSYDDGYYVYNDVKRYSYRWNNDYYCIIRKMDSRNLVTANLIAAYICKLNKDTGFFEIVRTITEATDFTVPMYAFPSGEGNRVTVNVIGTENLYFNALDNKVTIFPSRSGGRDFEYPVKLLVDIPESNKPGILFRISPNANNNGYGYYLFVDNPLFNQSGGNFLLRF